MPFRTTDLLDENPGFEACRAGLRPFGGRRRFSGTAVTVRCAADNSRVRELLNTPGAGRVLVVDGLGLLSVALVGDQLGAAAVRNGWAGILVHGCVRDSAALAALDLGVLALGLSPRRSDKRGEGVVGITVEILGARIRPGDRVYVDEDGVVVAPGGDTAPLAAREA
jgi:regulator of ribonuclease activity A